MKTYLSCLLLVLTLVFIGQATPREGAGRAQNGDRVRSSFNGLELDSIAKQIVYVDPASRLYVEKYIKKTRLKRSGKLIANPDYNEAFAQMVYRLTQADLVFQFAYNPKTAEGKGGYIQYDGEQVTIVFGNAGAAYGGGVGHILFEETKHAVQVLDGQVFFIDADRDGTWGVISSIQAEVEAKLFVIDQLGYSMTYFDHESKLNIPTQLGMLAKKRGSLQSMCCFLKYGEKNITVVGEFKVNILGAYPHFSMKPIIYYQKEIKSETVLAYPFKPFLLIAD